ncbi:hypothetical protein NCS55_00166200 [Fusarium keratoplasticum]|nr:hypothetical protein NCS55_00166200 [Fusarium keratoplasticum]
MIISCSRDVHPLKRLAMLTMLSYSIPRAGISRRGPSTVSIYLASITGIMPIHSETCITVTWRPAKQASWLGITVELAYELVKFIVESDLTRVRDQSHDFLSMIQGLDRTHTSLTLAWSQVTKDESGLQPLGPIWGCSETDFGQKNLETSS